MSLHSRAAGLSPLCQFTSLSQPCRRASSLCGTERTAALGRLTSVLRGVSALPSQTRTSAGSSEGMAPSLLVTSAGSAESWLPSQLHMASIACCPRFSKESCPSTSAKVSSAISEPDRTAVNCKLLCSRAQRGGCPGHDWRPPRCSTISLIASCIPVNAWANASTGTPLSADARPFECEIQSVHLYVLPSRPSNQIAVNNIIQRRLTRLRQLDPVQTHHRVDDVQQKPGIGLAHPEHLRLRPRRVAHDAQPVPVRIE